MRVWLIRHGESESNAGLPTHGPAVSPLTETGRRQARCVAGSFTEPPQLIVSSAFARARETAEPTIARFPGVPYAEWPVQEFTYLGRLHGPATTAGQRLPHVREYWDRADPGYVNGGNGESFADLIARVCDLLGRLAPRSEAFVAVFTHGIFMRALMWSLLTGVTEPDSERMREFRRFLTTCATPNGGIVEVRYRDGGDPYLVGAGTAHLPEALVTGRD